ncbi:MAG TPA: response regulator [Clostridia bacterium]|nr:response regulator [Clostridia bacterium]
MHILVVDDSAFMRMRTANLLKGAGYEVIEAENGRVAVEVYKQRRPAVVLMDITMPEMDGLEALRAIKEVDRDANVVMVSALAQSSLIMEAIQAGARDFVVKPYQPDRLLFAVRKVLGGNTEGECGATCSGG